ncbi:MAG TPA: TRAP transporter large permease [Candidatus Acidoferrales bacterium]|nr:TRAP transporter large permease [Candidatus Acidoferrales bacterium]
MILIVVVFFMLLALGVPILAALGIGAFAALLASGIPAEEFAHTVEGGLENFTLLSIPLFLLAGEIMAKGGISARLTRLVTMIVGNMPGGLGISVVVATMLFSGISGSVNADAAAIGSVMMPPMFTAGYRPQWASAIVAAAAGTGILIPPSITMIVLGTIANLSIKELFLASLLPATLIGIGKAIVIFYKAKLGIEKTNESVHVTPAALWKAFLDAIPALLAPAIIIGGILSGVFTATESAAVAVIYAGFLSIVVYREIDLKVFIDLMISAARMTGVVVALVGVASAVAYVIAYNQFSDALAAWAGSYVTHYFVFASIVMILFWLLGALMDGIPALVILIPLFMPLALKAGMSPIHFAIFSLAIFGISLVTPPIGTACFVVSAIARVNIRALVVPMIPFMLIMFATILLLAYVPWFSLALPRLVGGYVGP